MLATEPQNNKVMVVSDKNVGHEMDCINAWHDMGQKTTKQQPDGP